MAQPLKTVRRVFLCTEEEAALIERAASVASLSLAAWIRSAAVAAARRDPD